MFFKICILGVVLAAGGFGQAAEQQSTGELSARELYYREKPVNETLPAISTTAAGEAPQTAQPKPKKERRSTTSIIPKTQPKTAPPRGDTARSQSHSDSPVNVPEQPRVAPIPIPVVEHLGLRYSLLSVDKDTNKTEPVDPDRVFHSGDCLALELEPNRAGYLYVFAKSSNGNYDPLFPSPQMQDESEVVNGRTKQRAPQNYCFELDEQTGDEHLYLIFSRNRQQVYDLHEAVLKRQATKLIADADEFNKEASSTVEQLASRGFKVTKVSAPQSGELKYSVYVVPSVEEKKDTVFADIRIKHQ